MLRHTIDRIAGLIPRDRQLVLIGEGHWEHATRSLVGHPAGNIIEQPLFRETAPGILYSILHVFCRDPNAAVGIFPSDHFILEEHRFMDCVAKGFDLLPRYPDGVIALTVRPERPENGYGWFENGGEIDRVNGTALLRAGGFLEKPDEATTLRLFASGGLVSTMVLLGRAVAFLRLFERLTPGLTGVFAPLLQTIGTRREHESAKRAFGRIAPMNYSSLILEHSFRGVNLINADDVYWSDWGDPGRIREDIIRFGLRNRAAIGRFHRHALHSSHGNKVELGRLWRQ
jgi:mannose-1-phosphate guanylyltransferase